MPAERPHETAAEGSAPMHPDASPARPGPAVAAPPPSRDVGRALARPPALLCLALLVGLYAAPAYVLMRPVVDADIWWHLATGRWVVEHRALPQTDPFSIYGHNRPYVAYSWLFDVAVYELYQALGLTGILAFRLLVAVALLVAVHRFVVRREPRFLRATALTALAFLALSGMLYERSWLFTLLFTLFTLEAVLRLRDGTATRAVWLLPVAYALWANLHVQFIYGLALLGLACVAPLGDALLRGPLSGRWADTPGTPAWRRLVALTAACAAATLLNPYHVRLYAVVLEYASQKVPLQVVHELASPSFRNAPDWAFLILALLGAFALGRRRPRPSLFELLLFAGTAFAAFRSRRDTWILILVSLAACTAGPVPALRAGQHFVLTWGRVAVVAAVAAAVFAYFGLQRNLSEQGLTNTVAGTYPAAAVADIRREGYPGPIFNSFDWGGYLIWALPEYPVSFDGRVNVHGDVRLATHSNTNRGLGWEKDPELMKEARLVLVSKAGPLPAVLRLHPHFRLVYEDDQAAVFVTNEQPPRTPS